jgi:hypothetical protein
MTRARTTAPKQTAPACLALLAGATLLVPGCYTRTVESRGIGTRWQTEDRYEPNLKTSEEGGSLFDGAGDLLIGPRKIEDRRR